MPRARLPEPPPDARLLPYATADDLAGLREQVRLAARGAGLAASRTEALIVAVNELASNSIEHTVAGTGILRIWSDAEAVVCQVEDHGNLDGTRISRDLTRAPGLRGYGIPLVHQFTDQAECSSGPDGTIWQLRMKLDGADHIGQRG